MIVQCVCLSRCDAQRIWIRQDMRNACSEIFRTKIPKARSCASTAGIIEKNVAESSLLSSLLLRDVRVCVYWFCPYACVRYWENDI